MSRLSAYPTSHHRSHSAVSVAASDTTYHSFYDAELAEPTSPVAAPRHPPKSDEQYTPKPIVRHDSGYESAHSGSSYGREPKIARRRSASQSRQHHRRPLLKRASRSGSKTPFPRLSENYPRVCTPKQHAHTSALYYFPSPEETAPAGAQDDATSEESELEPKYYPLPPQTTHYWMSDHTRRLEYAAIDAASRGVKGWIIKHMPDCFVPKDNRRLTFDDDSGSVRRYRLELDTDELSLKECKRANKKWKWSFKR